MHFRKFFRPSCTDKAHETGYVLIPTFTKEAIFISKHAFATTLTGLEIVAKCCRRKHYVLLTIK